MGWNLSRLFGAVAIGACAWLVAAPVLAGDKKKKGDAHAQMEFESFQLVLLKKGPEWSGEKTPAMEELQKKHLGHLTKMAEEGHMVVAGPFGDQPDDSLRGLCLYKVGSVDEARKLAEADPAVQANHLEVEVLTWWTERGAMTFPAAEKLRKKK